MPALLSSTNRADQLSTRWPSAHGSADQPLGDPLRDVAVHQRRFHSAVELRTEALIFQKGCRARLHRRAAGPSSYARRRLSSRADRRRIRGVRPPHQFARAYRSNSAWPRETRASSEWRGDDSRPRSRTTSRKRALSSPVTVHWCGSPTERLAIRLQPSALRVPRSPRVIRPSTMWYSPEN
jgi:hypothetical protein